MKVALIQQSYKGSKKATIKHTTSQIKEASQNGASLILLQELHQSEYFCQCEDTAYFRYADDFNQDCKYWAKISKKHNIVLVTSLFEKRDAGIYHNSAVVFDKGKIAGKYRKMHIPDDPGFYEKFYFTPGDIGFKAIDTSVGKLGVLICWDQWYPEAARIMALQGAKILIYPTAIGWFDSDTSKEKTRQLNSWIDIQKSHSIANGVYTISINRVGYEKDPSGMQEGIRFWGNSFVCSAGGEIIAQANDKDDTILYANIDLTEIEKVRDIWPFFRDRRIDSYKNILKRYLI
jgi:N-carbamoylputrescine amidase